jgi:hypothetical protein
MRQAPAYEFESDDIFVVRAVKMGLAGVVARFVAEALRRSTPSGPRSSLWY